MNHIISIRPERTFADELRRHQDEEARLESRAERIKERAQDLLKSEYYPYHDDNFAEALAEINEVQLRLIATHVSEAVQQGLDNPQENHSALLALRLAVESYWLKEALAVARKEQQGADTNVF